MNTRIFTITIIACLFALSLAGCTEKEPTVEDIVKSDAEYKQQAEKEINKENLLDELGKLEEEVQQDASSQ